MYRFTGFFVLLASCVLMTPGVRADDNSPLMLEAPKPAPTLTYIDENGAMKAINPAEAKLTAVHFWATWCAPCVAELPEVDGAAKAYRSKGLRIIAISADDSNMAKVLEFYTAHHITGLAPALDNAMASFEAVQSPGLPITVFIDPKGNEIARAVGPLDWKSKATTDFLNAQLK